MPVDPNVLPPDPRRGDDAENVILVPPPGPKPRLVPAPPPVPGSFEARLDAGYESMRPVRRARGTGLASSDEVRFRVRGRRTW